MWCRLAGSICSSGDYVHQQLIASADCAWLLCRSSKGKRTMGRRWTCGPAAAACTSCCAAIIRELPLFWSLPRLCWARFCSAGTHRNCAVGRRWSGCSTYPTLPNPGFGRLGTTRRRRPSSACRPCSRAWSPAATTRCAPRCAHQQCTPARAPYPLPAHGLRVFVWQLPCRVT
jgi:hypothetical protein